MKKVIITAFLAVISAININATTILNDFQFDNQLVAKSVFADEKINVIFQRNNPAKGSTTYILTIEEPSGTKKTETITMTDGSKRKTVAIMVGSKVYVKNASKLNMLEGGQNQSDSDPLMTVMLRDKNQVINLDEEKNASQSVLEANAQKSATKLKLSEDLQKETVVNGNTATITYKSKSGSPMASFDMDKKTGNVKNIVDMSKANAGKPEDKAKKEGEKKLKGLFGK